MSDQTQNPGGPANGSDDQPKPQMPRRRPARFGRGGPGTPPPGGAAPAVPSAPSAPGTPAASGAPGAMPGGMPNPGITQAELNPAAQVDKLVGVVSGKGGVGKSMTTALLAVALQRAGHRVAILDADLTGPSIPRMFGLDGMAVGNEEGIRPRITKTGIQIMSINLLLEDEGEPVVWRGPVLGNVIKQFWSDVIWDSVDYMLLDMPPGTGDVPLTIYQSLPVDGSVIVTTPQSLVNMVVTKSVRMAEKMDVPVLGLIENMSYFEAPDTGAKYEVFGPSHIDEIASQHEMAALAKLPIDPRVTALSDEGRIEDVASIWPEELFDSLAEKLQSLVDEV